MIRANVFSTSRLSTGGLRLDGTYYCSIGEETRRHLFRSGLTIDTIGQVTSDIFIGGRGRRIYVRDPRQGVQFLSSSDMLLADFSNMPYISRITPNLKRMMLQDGWTLVSRSGTIGNTAYVRREMAGLAGSEHIMRVVPNASIRSGYLYAWLSSVGGVGLVKQGTFGSVIPTIEPAYMASLPIPRLSDKIERQIHDLIEQAAANRVEANRLLKLASEQVYAATGLPRYEDAPVGRNLKGLRTYVLPKGELGTRFEGRFHDCFVRDMQMTIRSNSSCGHTELHEVANVFLPNRGKWANVISYKLRG